MQKLKILKQLNKQKRFNKGEIKMKNYEVTYWFENNNNVKVINLKI